MRLINQAAVAELVQRFLNELPALALLLAALPEPSLVVTVAVMSGVAWEPSPEVPTA
jgi:hypothetical protein